MRDREATLGFFHGAAQNDAFHRRDGDFLLVRMDECLFLHDLIVAHGIKVFESFEGDSVWRALSLERSKIRQFIRRLAVVKQICNEETLSESRNQVQGIFLK